MKILDKWKLFILRIVCTYLQVCLLQLHVDETKTENALYAIT